MAGAGLSIPHSAAPSARLPSLGRLRARLQSRLRRSSLDRALAAGAEARGSAALSCRASELINARNRRQLADSLAALTEATQVPARHRGSVIAPNRREVIDAQGQIAHIEEILRCGWPIAPRGAALLRVVLTDPAGPLYAPDPGAFKHHLCAVIDALDGVRSAA